MQNQKTKSYICFGHCLTSELVKRDPEKFDLSITVLNIPTYVYVQELQMLKDISSILVNFEKLGLISMPHDPLREKL